MAVFIDWEGCAGAREGGTAAVQTVRYVDGFLRRGCRRGVGDPGGQGHGCEGQGDGCECISEGQRAQDWRRYTS